MTTKCYRLAIKPSQGIGIVPWGIGGDLPFPEANTGVIKGFDSDNQAISLVLDSSSGRFYRIGVKEVWQDKIGVYGGTEINSMIRVKEHVGIDGEELTLEHIESRTHLRPYDEDNKGASGYTAAGFLENQRISLKMFANGDTDNPVAKLKFVSQYGDYVFGKRIEAKRLQLQIETTASSYKITRIRQKLQNINKVTPDETGGIRTENLYQKMFREQDLWMTRDSYKPLMNRYDGELMAGTYDTLITGPDGVSNSAMQIDNSDTITDILPVISLVSSVSFWQGNPSGTFYITIGDLEITTYRNAGVINIDLAWNSVGFLDEPLSTGYTGWALITITCDGSNFYVYENGILLHIVAVPGGATTYGGSLTITAGADVSIFDIRRIPRQIGAEALQWYYDDVVNNEGNGGLLPIMR